MEPGLSLCLRAIGLGVGMWLLETSPLLPGPKRCVQAVTGLCFLGSTLRLFGVF